MAQDAPRTELGARLAENHGDGAFHRLEEVKLRRAVAYPDGTAFGLKTPTAAYQAYLAGLRAVEEEAGVTTLLVNNVLRRTIPGRPEDWPIKPYCDWDIVVLKHYPSWRAWETVEGSAAQEAALVHREAAVAAGHVVVAVARQPPAAPRQVTSDDTADTAIHVVNLIVLPAWSQARAIGRLLGDVRREAERLVDSDIPDQEKELRASELMDRVERDISAGLWAERVRLGLPRFRSDAARTILLTQERYEAETELLRNRNEELERLLEQDRREPLEELLIREVPADKSHDSGDRLR